MKDVKRTILSYWNLAIFAALFATATAFAQDTASVVVPELAISEQPAAISIAEKDKPVDYFCRPKGGRDRLVPVVPVCRWLYGKCRGHRRG